MSMWEVIVYFLLISLFFWWVVFPLVNKFTKRANWKNKQWAKLNEEYRLLSESANQLDLEIKEGQEKMHQELAQLNKRMASIEKMLREVE